MKKKKKTIIEFKLSKKNVLLRKNEKVYIFSYIDGDGRS